MFTVHCLCLWSGCVFSAFAAFACNNSVHDNGHQCSLPFASALAALSFSAFTAFACGFTARAVLSTTAVVCEEQRPFHRLHSRHRLLKHARFQFRHAVPNTTNAGRASTRLTTPEAFHGPQARPHVRDVLLSTSVSASVSSVLVSQFLSLFLLFLVPLLVLSCPSSCPSSCSFLFFSFLFLSFFF